jgi:hypothetical protein
MQSVTTLCRQFQNLGTPTEAARTYNILPEEYLESIGPTGRFMLDLDCLQESYEREKEHYDQDRKEKEYSAKYGPGCRVFEGEEKWDAVARAKEEEHRLKSLAAQKPNRRKKEELTDLIKRSGGRNPLIRRE